MQAPGYHINGVPADSLCNRARKDGSCGKPKRIQRWRESLRLFGDVEHGADGGPRLRIRGRCPVHGKNIDPQDGKNPDPSRKWPVTRIQWIIPAIPVNDNRICIVRSFSALASSSWRRSWNTGSAFDITASVPQPSNRPPKLSILSEGLHTRHPEKKREDWPAILLVESGPSEIEMHSTDCRALGGRSLKDVGSTDRVKMDIAPTV